MTNDVIDESALKLFLAQMEALKCVVLALRSPAHFEAGLEYALEKRLEGRADNDLTALGVAQLLSLLRADRGDEDRPQPPQLRLIQGGLSKPKSS
jgi:hypothetical protein